MGAIKEPIKSCIARLEGARIYLDTNIFIYVLNNTPRFVDACLPFFMAIAEDKIQGFSGDLAIAELLVKPLKDHDLGTVQKVKALFDAKLGYFTALAHDREVFELAAQLRATQRLGMADAIHAATAIKHGCAYFLSFDAKLARNTLGVEVIDIAQWLD